MGSNKLVKDTDKHTIKGILGKETEVCHKRILDRYGFFPRSVWYVNKSDEITQFYGDTAPFRYKQGRRLEIPGAAFDIGDKKVIPLSEFNPNIARRCLMMWSHETHTVLNPFAGRGTVCFVTAYFGCQTIGIEIVPTYARHIIEHAINLIQQGETWASNVRVINGDAVNLVDLVGTQVDYILSSPPYWNVEKYESVTGQLSDCKRYKHFLTKYKQIIEQCHAILKPDRYCTFVVADFRKNGKFYWFSGDTIRIFRETGFKVHDIVISVLKSPFYAQVGKLVDELHRTVKMHEYILTFKKEE